MTSLLGCLTVPKFIKLNKCLILPTPNAHTLDLYITHARDAWIPSGLEDGCEVKGLFERPVASSPAWDFGDQYALLSLDENGLLIDLRGRHLDVSQLPGTFVQIASAGPQLLLLSKEGAITSAELGKNGKVVRPKYGHDGIRDVVRVIDDGTCLRSDGRAITVYGHDIPGVYTDIFDLHTGTGLVTADNKLTLTDMEGDLIETHQLPFTPRQVVASYSCGYDWIYLLSASGEVYAMTLNYPSKSLVGHKRHKLAKLNLPICVAIEMADDDRGAWYLTLTGKEGVTYG